MWPKPEHAAERYEGVRAPALDENPFGVIDGVATRWVTKDKRSLLIAEMSDQHLQFTVRMLERKQVALQRRADACMGAVGTLGGDMAIYYATSEAETAGVDEVRFRLAAAPILAGLRAELQRRGLPELSL